MVEDRSVAERMAMLPPDERRKLLRGWSEAKCAEFLQSWCIWARPSQLPPKGDWRLWLMMAGRGYGKTRAGAEWVHWLAEAPALRIALVGPSEDEARAVMVEGSSGLLACATAAAQPQWEPSRGVLSWPSGTQAFVYSGAHPEGLRGPEHDFAWCDEVAKWARGAASWDNMMLGLRRGERPQVLATTTPRPGALLRRLMRSEGLVLTRGRTEDNVQLSRGYLAHVTRLYGGTRLGRQELDGELIEDVAGALWSRDTIERCRVARPPEAARIVIGVDPPASSEGDACGIVAVMLGADGCGYVIEDASVEAQAPEGWARAVAACAARHGADRVVAEANNGGEMVRSVLLAASVALPVKLVHASRGKAARAEPVSLLYERGRVFHAGAFPELEDQMCGLVTGGGYEGPGRSPDRADALVWALTELMLGKRREVRVRGL